MATVDSYVDWTGCELVERVPGKVSGRPIVRGTRILADTIVQDAELGSPLDEIHENYPRSVDRSDRAADRVCQRATRVGLCREDFVRSQSTAQAKNPPRHIPQSLTGRRLAIIALSTNNWPIVKDHVPEILSAIDTALPGSFQAVNCGAFSRKDIAGE
jgi:uncharacterized protein (DUF433 family)